MPAIVENPPADVLREAVASVGEAERVSSVGRITTVPEDAWDRVVVALWRSLDYMPAEAQAKLRAALDMATLRALAVVMAVWAGFTFAGVGTVANAALAALGIVTVGSDLWRLLMGGKHAAFAKSPGELETAAREIAAAILGLGVDLVLGYLTGRVLAQVKRGIEAVRGSALRGRAFFAEFFEKPGSRPRQPPEGSGGKSKTPQERTGAEPEKPPKGPLAEPGLLTGMGANEGAKVVAQFPWGAAVGIGVGTVLCTAALVWALRRPKAVRDDLSV